MAAHHGGRIMSAFIGTSSSAPARERILARLRATAIAEALPLPDVKAWFDAHRRNEGSAQRVTRLRAALEAVKTEVHDVNATDWPDVLLRIAAAKGLRNLL